MFRMTFMGAFAIVSFLGLGAFATLRTAPHITPPQALVQSFVRLENTSDQALRYTLTPYTSDGRPLPAISGLAEAGSKRYALAAEFVGADASHFTFQADASLKLTIDFKSRATKKTISTKVVEKGAASWSFNASDWSSLTDSLAVVNLGEKATPIWLHQRDQQGRIVASKNLCAALQPQGKIMAVIDPLLFKADQTYSFEVVGDQYLAVLGLAMNQGELSLNAVHEKRMAESERDEIGTWFITDGTLSDVFEMMGYNVATDRMWQAELFRRLALGRLSEIFGPRFLNQDSQVRVTGYSQEEYQAGFDNLSEEERTVISSYADGFNRRIAELRADPSLIPYEFLALDLDISDWTVIDIMAWSITLQHQFSSGFGGLYQLDALAELQHLVGRFGKVAGAAIFLDVHWTNDPNALSMIPNDPGLTQTKSRSQVLPILNKDLPQIKDVAERLREQQEANIAELESIGAYIKGGSYAWVVSGDKTASGNPILYSGPQLESPRLFQAPAIVQEGSIRGGGIEVSGLIVTGVPAIIVGRTPHHAWSFQVGHANSQELYLDQPSSVISQRQEIIKVAGRDDVIVPVVTTVHGSVINASPLISFKYAQRNYEFGFVKATLGLARAQSMDEFGDAVKDLAVSMHICYADRDKNIAYWLSGRQPVRPHGSWIIPQGAAGHALEWDAAVIEPLAHDRNNAQGFYGGWNNKASAEVEDVAGRFLYGPFHRAHVITDYLATHNNLTFEDVANLAPRIATTGSTIAGSGNTWTIVGPRFKEIIEEHPSAARLDALEMIENWNGQAVAGEPEEWPFNLNLQDPWILQDTWLNNVVGLIFNDEFNDDYFGTNLFNSRFTTFLHMLRPETGLRKSYNWYRNDTTGGPDNLVDIVTTGLDQAISQLGERPWGENQRSITSFTHVLFGDLTALVPSIKTPYSNRATYAQCVEYGENGPVKIGTHFVLGQSGVITASDTGVPQINPAFFGMMPYFSTFTLRPFPLFD